MEATARWDFHLKSQYVVFKDTVYILDPTTHKLMVDLNASTSGPKERAGGTADWPRRSRKRTG